MKKIVIMLSCVMILTTGYAAHVSASPAQGGFQSAQIASGGFSGPGIVVSTVEQAKSMRDDAPVVLRGNIMRHLGKDKYLFKDQTGTITVEIDNDKWNGQNVNPGTTVELRGEVDKDWNSVEVDVDRVLVVQ